MFTKPMAVVFRAFFIGVSVLILGFSPLPSFSAELVGVLPFTNQRSGASDDWIGFYLQARIQSGLRANSDWSFHTLRTLQCWALGTDRSQPVSAQSTVLIVGSFQTVARFAHISLQIRRYRPQPMLKNFAVSFAVQALDETLDDLSRQVGQWIDPGFKFRKQPDFPQYRNPQTETHFRLQQQLFVPEAFPETRLVLQMEEWVTVEQPPDLIAGLAESQLVLSRNLNETERVSLLNRSESLLRQAVIRHPGHAALQVLLAEVYFLNDRLPAWVEKTAEEALQLDSQQELALVLILLVMEEDEAARRERLLRLEAVNPWFWTVAKQGTVPYQKNLLQPYWFSAFSPKPQRGRDAGNLAAGDGFRERSGVS